MNNRKYLYYFAISILLILIQTNMDAAIPPQ
jgi:hypothetical protein